MRFFFIVASALLLLSCSKDRKIGDAVPQGEYCIHGNPDYRVVTSGRHILLDNQGVLFPDGTHKFVKTRFLLKCDSVVPGSER